MPVNTPCDAYEQFLPRWQRMRDAVQGEDKIKEKGAQYLRVPTGLTQAENYKEAYDSYKSRARYPEFVAPAIEGMVGLMSRKESLPDLPTQMEYLTKRATYDGLPLESLKRRIEHEVCTTGRMVLFIDMPDEGGNPYIATYPAGAVINWRGDGEETTLVVFEEEFEVPKPGDPYVTETKKQWRSAEIEDGACVVRLWEKRDKESEPVVMEEYVLNNKGEALTFVPVVFVGSRDLLPDPDAIPLEGVARQAVHYYRQYADYAMQLYMSANGTMPYFFGMQDAEVPNCVGPDQLAHSTNADAKGGYLEVAGTGLEQQKLELDEIKKDMAMNTIKVLGDKKTAEAAETLRLRFQSQTATLASISRATAAGLERALRYCAEWIGVDPDQIVVQPHTDFIREEPDPQLIDTISDKVERGFMPDNILIDYLRRVELHSMDVQEYRQWTPMGQSLPAGDDG